MAKTPSEVKIVSDLNDMDIIGTYKLNIAFCHTELWLRAAYKQIKDKIIIPSNYIDIMELYKYYDTTSSAVDAEKTINGMWKDIIEKYNDYDKYESDTVADENGIVLREYRDWHCYTISDKLVSKNEFSPVILKKVYIGLKESKEDSSMLEKSFSGINITENYSAEIYTSLKTFYYTILSYCKGKLIEYYSELLKVIDGMNSMQSPTMQSFRTYVLNKIENEWKGKDGPFIFKHFTQNFKIKDKTEDSVISLDDLNHNLTIETEYLNSDDLNERNQSFSIKNFKKLFVIVPWDLGLESGENNAPDANLTYRVIDKNGKSHPLDIANLIPFPSVTKINKTFNIYGYIEKNGQKYGLSKIDDGVFCFFSRYNLDGDPLKSVTFTYDETTSTIEKIELEYQTSKPKQSLSNPEYSDIEKCNVNSLFCAAKVNSHLVYIPLSINLKDVGTDVTHDPDAKRAENDDGEKVDFGGNGEDYAVYTGPETEMEEVYYANSFEEDSYSNDMLMPNKEKNIFDYTDVSENLSEYHIHSLKSVIGLPAKFLPHVDMAVASTTTNKYDGFGRLYTKQIIYDMPICTIKPGVPDPSQESFIETIWGKGLFRTIATAYKEIKSLIDNPIETLEGWFVSICVNDYRRLYEFQSDMLHYIDYVNTLCHMFAIFLGIGDKKYYYESKKMSVPYNQFNEWYELGATLAEGSMDISENGYNNLSGDEYDSIKTLFGGDPAVYIYFSPDSVPRDTFSTSTDESMIDGAINSASEMSKQIQFIGGAALGDAVSSMFKGVGDFVNDIGQKFSGGILSGLFSGLGEGVGVIVGGHKYDSPEMWSDTRRETGVDLNIKLISPYGDPESIFLYVMRPLAKLLAFSIPRQYGANSYTSPFIIQAFSKGIFNVSFGIVESLQISRGGAGGAQHNVSFIPTELDVNISISDMYPQIALSNEYAGQGKSLLSIITGKAITGAPKAIALLFNNIGLLNFAASYCGYNMNAPANDIMFMYFWQIFHNRIERDIDIHFGDESKFLGISGVSFPWFTAKRMDMYNNTIASVRKFGVM